MVPPWESLAERALMLRARQSPRERLEPELWRALQVEIPPGRLLVRRTLSKQRESLEPRMLRTEPSPKVGDR